MPGTAAAPPPPERRRRRTPPRPLGGLLVVVLLVGLSWALIVPPWQSPDELAHFAYAQSLAESFALPASAGRPQDSSDLAVADGAVGASRTAFFPRFAPPDWSPGGQAAYLAQATGGHPPSRTDGGGPSTASGNPPLYYLYAAVGSLIDHGGTAFGRLYTMRILGVLLLLVSTVGAWLLAGEVFARRRLPQLVCAATAGLLPMAAFMSTNINPDALLMTTWTCVFWLGARVINRRAPARDVAALCAATAAAVLTKATSYALVLPVVLAILAGWWRQEGPQRRPTALRLLLCLLVLAVPVIGWVAVAHSLGGTSITSVSSGGHPFNVRQFLSYVWQFYLPRLPFLTPFRTTPGLPVYDIWGHGVTGVFGWADIDLPLWLYPVAGWVFAGVGVTILALLTRLRDRRALTLLAFFGLSLVALLGLLHITEYRVLIAGGGQFLQGRYLLPVVALLGLVLGLIVSCVPMRFRALAGSLVLTGLLALQAISLATIVKAYYL